MEMLTSLLFPAAVIAGAVGLPLLGCCALWGVIRGPARWYWGGMLAWCLAILPFQYLHDRLLAFGEPGEYPVFIGTTLLLWGMPAGYAVLGCRIRSLRSDWPLCVGAAVIFLIGGYGCAYLWWRGLS